MNANTDVPETARTAQHEPAVSRISIKLKDQHRRDRCTDSLAVLRQ